MSTRGRQFPIPAMSQTRLGVNSTPIMLPRTVFNTPYNSRFSTFHRCKSTKYIADKRGDSPCAASERAQTRTSKSPTKQKPASSARKFMSGRSSSHISRKVVPWILACHPPTRRHLPSRAQHALLPGPSSLSNEMLLCCGPGPGNENEGS